MSLRLHINLITTCLLALFASVVIGLQVGNIRNSVREEIEGSGMVASQLLSRMEWIYQSGGLEAMAGFLTQVGRIRSNDVELFDDHGTTIFHSPPSQYEANRSAPAWFAALVSPPVQAREIQLPNGRLVLRPDPSRAALEGWDELRPTLLVVLAGFVAGNLLVWALVGRALKPLRLVVDGLRRLEQGAWDTRLPTLSGHEARQVGQAFNSMAQSVQDGAAAQLRAQAAQSALAQNRELTEIIQSRIEEVRGAIARELHDELGQQLTAIKSIGLSIARRNEHHDAQTAASARLVVECADQMYGSVHHLISELRPLALDRFGLHDAVLDLLDDWRSRHPDIAITLHSSGDLGQLDTRHTTAAYRIVQESVTNALRHASASRIDVSLAHTPHNLLLEVRDDGQSAPDSFATPGHFGVLGMRERAQALGGTFELLPATPHGVCVRVRLPLEAHL